MLDIKFIRDNSEKVKENIARRGMDVNIDELLKLDELRREQIRNVDETRAIQNRLSEEIEQGGEGREEKITESREVKESLRLVSAALDETEAAYGALMRQLPNLLFDEVPTGRDETDNKVLREVGTHPKFKYTAVDYMKIGEALDLIDIKRAAKVSGSRFGYLRREAALLESALVRFAYDVLGEHDFVAISPPVMIKEEMMRGMGYVDSEEDREERYFFEKDDLYLVGTAEQSIGPMHQGEILDESKLPIRYAGFSTCFRREAGSYGKDTHGILRVHQFNKVEMFTISLPESSSGEHSLMLELEERLMQELELPYRVVQLCSADIARPSAATYDIDAWLPGQNEGKGEYRETHSTSDTTSFQSRRLNIRVRRKDGTIEFVHMQNGTAFAIGRMIIAILENYQQEDGSVKVPKVLQRYMGGMEEIRR